MITRIEGENFKRVRAVSFTPKEKGATIIGGKNGAGKSSSLDIVSAVLGGADSCPGDPVRHGEKKARCLVETDKIKAVRTFTAKGSRVEVTDHNGAKFTSPQALLDELWGKFTIDPLAFARAKFKDQGETLRKIAGLDFTAEDAARKAAYDERTLATREIKRLQGAVDSLPDGEAGDEVSVAALTAELDAKIQINAENQRKRDLLGGMRTAAIRQQGVVDRLHSQLAEEEAALAAATEKGKALSVEVKALEDQDVSAVRAKIAGAEAANAKARAGAERARLQAELDAAIDGSEALTTKIAEIDGVKADAIAKAAYPIPGLAVTDDGWTLDGVPGDQVCQSGQLKVSTAIALKLNPGRALLIREGAFLDDDSLRMIDEMATAAGEQVLVEVVGDREGVMVVIEDGEVAETR